MEGEGERRPGERRKAGRATGPWSPERSVAPGGSSYSSIPPRPRPETADRERDRQSHARHVDEQGQRPECRQRSLDVGEVERPQRYRQRDDAAVHDMRTGEPPFASEMMTAEAMSSTPQIRPPQRIARPAVRRGSSTELTEALNGSLSANGCLSGSFDPSFRTLGSSSKAESLRIRDRLQGSKDPGGVLQTSDPGSSLPPSSLPPPSRKEGANAEILNSVIQR
jgi:hypothetical protein